MTDTESHETVVQLIGAWALAACSPRRRSSSRST